MFQRLELALPSHLVKLLEPPPAPPPQEELPGWIPPDVGMENVADPSLVPARDGWTEKDWKLIQDLTFYTMADGRTVNVPGVYCTANVQWYIEPPPFTNPVNSRTGCMDGTRCHGWPNYTSLVLCIWRCSWVGRRVNGRTCCTASSPASRWSGMSLILSIISSWCALDDPANPK